MENEKDYSVEGYTTIFHIRNNPDQKVRMLCLIKDSSSHMIKIRTDLMSDQFVSIWLEVKTSNMQSNLVSGFYREWTHLGVNSQDCQVERMKLHFLQTPAN